MTIDKKRRSASRDPQRVAFARDQRRIANEFARDDWQMLRASRICGVKFRREHPIGPYTIDFVSLAIKLVIEVDGKDHFTGEGMSRDRKRDKHLREEGSEILRIQGYHVTQDCIAVRNTIEQAIRARQAQLQQPPHPQPLSPRQAGGEGSRDGVA